jgi:hypothetical protein
VNACNRQFSTANFRIARHLLAIGGKPAVQFTTTLMAWVDSPISVFAIMRPSAATSQEIGLRRADFGALAMRRKWDSYDRAVPPLVQQCLPVRKPTHRNRSVRRNLPFELVTYASTPPLSEERYATQLPSGENRACRIGYGDADRNFLGLRSSFMWSTYKEIGVGGAAA